MRRHDDLACVPLIGFGEDPDCAQHLQGLGAEVAQEALVGGYASHLGHWQMCPSGLGAGVAPVWAGDADPRVICGLPDAPVLTFPVWLVAMRELRSSRRLLLVHDHLARSLSRMPISGQSSLDAPSNPS